MAGEVVAVCNKVAYTTKKKAIKAKDRAAQNHSDPYYRKAEKSVYTCRRCGLWHVTSQDRRLDNL